MKRTEIAEVDMSHPPTDLYFEKPGLYTVYTNDYDLLVINDELIKHKMAPWLEITEISSGTPVKVDYVERGLRIYDTPLAKGRPIHTFHIENPGAYEIGHLTKQVSIYFLPDYMTGNEDLIAMSFLSQLAILLVVAGFFYRRKTKIRAAKVQEVKNLKKINDDDGKQFWRGYQEDPNDKKKNDYWRNIKNRPPSQAACIIKNSSLVYKHRQMTQRNDIAPLLQIPFGEDGCFSGNRRPRFFHQSPHPFQG